MESYSILVNLNILSIKEIKYLYCLQEYLLAYLKSYNLLSSK